MSNDDDSPQRNLFNTRNIIPRPPLHSIMPPRTTKEASSFIQRTVNLNRNLNQP
jgi:hypothetical protein